MSRFVLQVRYTGVGPRSGIWLNAANPGGFCVNDKTTTREEAEREEARLKRMAPQFLDPKSDWETRILAPDGQPTVEPVAEPQPEPEPAMEPAPDPGPKPSFFGTVKKKTKKKKKKTTA